MNQQFFLMMEKEMAPWIMDTRAKRSRDHRDPGWDDVGWTEPRGPIELTLMDTGEFWPDIIGCGADIMGLYVSERVKRDWDAERIDYGKCFPATVVGDLPPALVNAPPPMYYWMGGHVGVRIDYEKSGRKRVGASKRTGRTYFDPAVKSKRIAFVEGSWDGTDLFAARLPMTQPFCTQRIVDLVAKHKRTNFEFIPIEEAAGW